MNDQVCKSMFLELPVFPVRRQVTAVCNGGIKNWSCMQRKGCGAQGDRRNVPYEKLKETGDEARARLPCLSSSSTSQQCACSRRKRVVLPVKVSGFLWACVQLTDYMQPRVCVRPREGPRASELGSRRTCFVLISFLGCRSEQKSRFDSRVRERSLTEWAKAASVTFSDVSQLVTNTDNKQLHASSMILAKNSTAQAWHKLQLSALQQAVPPFTQIIHKHLEALSCALVIVGVVRYSQMCLPVCPLSSLRMLYTEILQKSMSFRKELIKLS